MRGVMRSHPGKPRGWRPDCETCGQKVKHRYSRFCCPQCVPRSVRAENCSKSRKTFAYRQRARHFREDLARLDRTVTRDELMAVLWQAYRRGYNAGFQVARHNRSDAAYRAAQERGAA